MGVTHLKIKKEESAGAAIAGEIGREVSSAALAFSPESTYWAPDLRNSASRLRVIDFGASCSLAPLS